MGNPNTSIFFMFFKLCLVFALCNASGDDERKPYIVYMGALPAEGSKISLSAVHDNILSQAIGDESIARQSKIHTYGRSFNALAAKLLPHEAKILSEKAGVVSVFPSVNRKLHTTHSWDFLGMPTTVKRNLKVESDIIIGLIDSGIWVESPSFNDSGIGPPPAKWKGKCQNGLNFTGCNNKVIGAQAFSLVNPNNKSTSPADFDGHGTHTSSIVAGSLHQGASLYGLLNGTARGGVPAARIAMYKACNGDLCKDEDILAAFDAAIADGVDILSVSLGAIATSYNNDPTAIGSFHAMQKGILTSCSAGNNGLWTTVQNVAPWILTVAAASTDRHLETQLQLGDEQIFSGISINLVNSGPFPLINGTQADLSKMPATVVNFTEFHDKIAKYINLTTQPTAVIHPTKVVNIEQSFVASFSSRGRQYIVPNLLKPDISAPGLNILAAFSPLISISRDVDDTRTSDYNVLSGTSMSCPHVSAVAAYVKSFHPDWSPAMIKSALMTTAKPLGVKDSDAEYAYGAGMVDPTAALNPGLVFDIDEAAYISFLCKVGYNGSTLVQITGNKTNDCSTISPATGKDGLNYPTINHDVRLNINTTNFDGVYHRTAINVGDGSAIYKAQIQAPKGLSIEVSPNILLFKNKNEKKSFNVTLSGRYPKDPTRRLSGSIIWSDTMHNVKIPIVI
ncbi:PREDICTED: subtilisin-like protease SBT4.15 [Ipomoea nil]|uniref:subtilisin-like protease SBT4.15 n=1 Tax=Ipomoea nil TaxID=35883 RepID=UPI000901AB7E|nr:PREDICTED: subtilisin-like protease SBT4.15 [Ipomoea nil]